MDELVDVIFRILRDTGELVAIVPGFPGDSTAVTCAGFRSNLQWVDVEVATTMKESKAALPDQYAELLQKLYWMGINVNTVRRVTRRHLEQRAIKRAERAARYD